MLEELIYDDDEEEDLDFSCLQDDANDDDLDSGFSDSDNEEEDSVAKDEL